MVYLQLHREIKMVGGSRQTVRLYRIVKGVRYAPKISVSRDVSKFVFA